MPARSRIIYCKRHTFYYHSLIFLRLTTEALMSTMVESTFGTEETQNAEVYHMLSTHSYTDAAHIKWITLSCPANIKHLSLSFQETVPRQCLKYTKADSEVKGFQEMTIQWIDWVTLQLPLMLCGYGSLQTASEALSYGLNFPGEHALRSPLNV